MLKTSSIRLLGAAAIIVSTAALAHAQSGNSGTNGSGIGMPECKPHEMNRQDCHVHDRDTYLHMKMQGVPKGEHAREEMQELDRKERRNMRR